MCKFILYFFKSFSVRGSLKILSNPSLYLFLDFSSIFCISFSIFCGFSNTSIKLKPSSPIRIKNGARKKLASSAVMNANGLTVCSNIIAGVSMPLFEMYCATFSMYSSSLVFVPSRFFLSNNSLNPIKEVRIKIF